MLRIQDFMSTNVRTIDSSASANDALEVMKQYRIHHLVVTSAKAPVGVVSKHDLNGNEDNTVSELMAPQIVTLGPKATLREAANMMRGHTIGCIPIVSDKRLVGIVTVSDLLELVGRGVHHVVPKGERPTLGRRMPTFAKNR